MSWSLDTRLANLWKYSSNKELENMWLSITIIFIRKFYCSFQKLGSDLQAPLKTRCIMQNQLYKLWYWIPSYKMSVTECTSKSFLWVWSCSTINWNLSVGRAVRLNSKEPFGMHSFMWWLVLYEGIRCDYIYSWFCIIHVVFKGAWKSLPIFWKEQYNFRMNIWELLFNRFDLIQFQR